MIARIWRGKVPREKADRYFDIKRDVAVPDYQRCKGNFGVWCLRRDAADDLTEITLITLWEDLGSIRGFAGDHAETAKYHEFDPDYLVELPEYVEHHDVSFAFGSREQAVAALA